MPKKTQISILGCGWLGLPLAEHLIRQGYTVKGATTRPEKLDMFQEKNIEPYLIRLDPEINKDYDPSFFKSDILVINIPPGRSRDDVVDFHLAQMHSLITALQNTNIRNVLFVSSTSVYPDLDREVREKDAGSPVRESGEALLQVEKMWKENTSFTTTTVRFAGLFGADRNPGRFLSGKTLDNNGEAPVNLIHLDDCVGVLSAIIELERWAEIYNACADAHPSKKEFYTAAAKKLDIAPPIFGGKEKGSFKIINSDKLKKELDFAFKYPDPMQAFK
jgi:nucleoside-diphosphate-sugar epimerase